VKWSLVLNEFDDVIKEFLVECYESLDGLDSDFISLEENPNDRERLASIFRTVHTIKGTSGFLAFPTLERVTHVGENLLVPLRDGKFELTHDMASSLLGMVDAIREILGNIEQEGSEGDENYEDLVAQLESMLHEKPAMPGEPSADAESIAEEQPASEESADDSEPEPQLDDEPAVSEPAATVAAATVQPKSNPKPAKPAGKQASSQKKTDSSLADSTIRIDVRLLDKLMNLVGELVLARNQIVQFSESSEDAGMMAASQRLNLITTELQEGVMKTRMQPIRNAWSKLPRVVRDLSSTCGKTVEVQMEGADTELDKTILEAIKDPLTHIVRNSVDHGIETPETRSAAGKSPEGTLTLRAFHEGGQVIIEISDDGGGINPERIRAKAIQNELLTEAQAETMNDRELTSLILLPGFSTAEKVTNVSGRGVGMDVVKTNIERIGGTLDIQSEMGIGTTLRIKIPLTLAIVPALIVATGGNHFAIPQVNLLELVRLTADGTAEKQIEFIHDIPVYRLRGKLLPIVYLDEQLELRHRRDRHDIDSTVNIVVLQAEDRSFGLVVDAVTDTQEIVVKPLGQHLKRIPTYAGATIMGDGRVALILDAIGLAHKSSVLSETRKQMLSDNVHVHDHDDSKSHAYLIVEAENDCRSAVRLSTIARLEEFELSDIETSRHGSVIQYRGSIMPLITLDHRPIPEDSSRVQVVVFTRGTNSVGVVVENIIDIVSSKDVGKNQHSGRIIIQDRITQLIDLEEIVGSQFPEIFTEADCEETEYANA
jgi:two-component system chemotaxis sensor kinase CheA